MREKNLSSVELKETDAVMQQRVLICFRGHQCTTCATLTCEVLHLYRTLSCPVLLKHAVYCMTASLTDGHYHTLANCTQAETYFLSKQQTCAAV